MAGVPISDLPLLRPDPTGFDTLLYDLGSRAVESDSRFSAAIDTAPMVQFEGYPEGSDYGVNAALEIARAFSPKRNYYLFPEIQRIRSRGHVVGWHRGLLQSDVDQDAHQKIEGYKQTPLRPDHYLIAQQMGTWCLIDRNLKPPILSRHTPIINDLWINIGVIYHPDHAKYTAPFVSAVETQRLVLQNQRVVELGSDTGLAGLLVLKYGAAAYLGVDKSVSTDYQELAQDNELDPHHMNSFEGDFNETYTQETVERFDPQVVLSNIGPHPMYGDSHLTAARIATTLPNVRTIILGGYTLNTRSQYGPSELFELMRDSGFILQSTVVNTHVFGYSAFVFQRVSS